MVSIIVYENNNPERRTQFTIISLNDLDARKNIL